MPNRKSNLFSYTNFNWQNIEVIKKLTKFSKKLKWTNTLGDKLRHSHHLPISPPPDGAIVAALLARISYSSEAMLTLTTWTTCGRLTR